MTDVESAIPHRPPFLLLDRIVSMDDDRITAEFTPRADDELFSRIYAGHYPGSPVTPGVLLCEIVFQAGAVLLSQRIDDAAAGVPVVTKIGGARFKHMVKPDDPLEVEAAIVDRVSNAFYLKGSIKSRGKLAVRVEFTCALVPYEAAPGGQP